VLVQLVELSQVELHIAGEIITMAALVIIELQITELVTEVHDHCMQK
jgi:hypothetical protein